MAKKFTFVLCLASLLAAPVMAQVDVSWTTADATNQHNAVRNAVNGGTQPGAVGSNPQPVPSPFLVPLSYSAAIAATADTWAAGCSFAHDPNLSTNCTQGNINVAGCGENIFASCGTTAPTILWNMNNVVVNSWGGESNNYDFPNVNCVAGQCGHYTAIAHQATQSVGCAAYQCTPAQLACADNCGGPMSCNSAVLVVCRYEDIILAGNRPYCTGAGTPAPCGPVPVELLNFEIH